jgi:hypothetical protein
VSAPTSTSWVKDPFLLFPDLGQARQSLQARDWPRVAAYFAGLTSDDATYALNRLAEEAPAGYLAELAATETGSTLARTMRGCQLIDEAWEIRTGYRASQVSGEQFRQFFARLRLAERQLIEATAVDPANVQAWMCRIITARGLQLGLPEARRRYDQGAKTDPFHVEAQSMFLQQTCRKWSGSHEQMHAFARECFAAAPPGSRAGVLIAEAHLERWLDLDAEPEAVAYLRQPEVQQELMDAGGRSVLHAGYQGGYHWASDHSTFAMLFSRAGNYPAAAVHFRALGNALALAPWDYLPGGEKTFHTERARALAKG